MMVVSGVVLGVGNGATYACHDASMLVEVEERTGQWKMQGRGARREETRRIDVIIIEC